MPDKQLSADSTPQDVVIYSQSRFSTKQKIFFIVLSVIIFFGILFLGLTGKLNIFKFINQDKVLTNKLLATVDKYPIYLYDVHTEIKKQYANPDLQKKELLQRFLNLLIEQALLDSEAKRLNITVEQSELQSYQYKKDGTNSAKIVSSDNINKARYKILKEKISAINTKSIEAFIISFWVPPYSDKNILTAKDNQYIETQRQEIKKILPEIENRFRKGDIPFDIAKDIHKTKPLLKPIVALNNYSLNQKNNDVMFNKPKIFTYNQSEQWKEFTNIIFSLKIGDTKIIEGKDGSGGAVIQVKRINQGNYKNYADWLNAKTKELVKIVNKL